MVNHVVPRDELRPFVMDMAGRIAQRPSFALKLAKESVNQTLEAQGQWTALRAPFSIQHRARAQPRPVRHPGRSRAQGSGGAMTARRPSPRPLGRPRDGGAAHSAEPASSS